MESRIQALQPQGALRTLLLAFLVGISLWHVSRYWGCAVDDSFIHLRYARNFIDGHGLVFNPGERVEGYTDICFVLLAALFLKLQIDPLAGLKCVTVIMAVWTLWLTARLEPVIAGPQQATEVLPFSVLSLFPLGAFVYWAFCPMGTMLFTALFLGSLSLTLHERAAGRWLGSGLVFVLLGLARPEGVYVFGICTAVLALVDYLYGRNWNHLGRHAANIALFAIFFGTYVAWRYHYYGNVLPNTFYAKVTGGAGHVTTGVAYFGDWLRAFPFFGATLLFPLALAVPGVRNRVHQPGLVIALYLIILAYIFSIVAVGGDFMPFYRFFIPIMPLSALLLALVLRALPLPTQARGRAVALLLSAHVVFGFLTEQPYRAFVAHRTAIVGKRVGEWLRERLAPDDLIAVNTAGSLPYYSGLPTIDMLGLTDAQIARRPVFITSKGWAGHRRGWGAYVLRRRPRVILWYNSAGSAEPFYLSDHELAADPLFRFFYQLRTVTLPPVGGEPTGRTVVRRFLGFPFGFNPAGEAPMASLGLSAVFKHGIVNLTTFFEGPILVTYFELDRRDEILWEDGLRLGSDVRGFVDSVAERWARDAAVEPRGDATARAEVEAMCAEAYHSIDRGDYAQARAILDEAARRNQAARSPMVYHYIANLAVISGHLLTAVSAQKEALRLAPGNRLYRENLHRLLTVPYKEFGRRAESAG
jgi:arabinofuranosyltransferase